MLKRTRREPIERPASPPKQGLHWWAKGIWLMIILVMAVGVVSSVEAVIQLLPRDKAAAAAVPAIGRFPSQSALLWGLQCARAGIDVSPTNSALMSQRSDVLSRCLSPEFQPDISSAQYDVTDNSKTYAPMSVQAIQPVGITPSDEHHAVAEYLVFLAGDRQRYYSVSIYAEDSTHFLMEGIPHPAPAPSDVAIPAIQPDNDPVVAAAIQPRLNNFFEAYFSSNADAMSGLSVGGKTFVSPPNDFPSGVSPFKGISKVTARSLGGGKFEAVVTVRIKDFVTKLISVAPYRVVLVRASDVSVGGSRSRYLVDSLSDTPTS